MVNEMLSLCERRERRTVAVSAGRRLFSLDARRLWQKCIGKEE